MCSEEFESIKSCLRNEIDLLKENNKNLEGRIEEMKINLMKMENLNMNLKTEVQKSKDLNQRLITIENCSQQKENEASLELIKNLEELMKVNKELKDRNDELETNIINSPKDQPISQKIEEEKCVKRKVDLQNVSPNMSPKTKWSKKTESLGNDFNDIDEECEELLAVTEATSGSMEVELDHVKMEIMRMISEKKQASELSDDNEKVKKMRDRVNQLELENKKLKQTIQELHSSMKIDPGDIHAEEDRAVRMPDIVVEQITIIDRSSPDGQEKEEEAPHAKEDVVKMDARVEQLELRNNELVTANNKLLEEKE